MNIAVVLFLVLLAPFLVVVFRGAPYVPTLQKQRLQLFKKLNLTSKDMFVDLGSGDGSLLLLAAQKGVPALGIERNIYLVLLSRWRIRKYKHLAKVQWGNMWRFSLPPQTTTVFMFGVSSIMPRINLWLDKQSKPFTFISYSNKIPGLKPSQTVGPFYFYYFKKD